MNLTNIIKKIIISILSMFNYPYISKNFMKNIKGPLLLHISDTPDDIYSYIFRIIEILKPRYIIHTGDMADNIKLEIHKDKLCYYGKSVKRLINGLEKGEFAKVYYVLGNHDDYSTVSKLSKKGKICDEGLLKIEGLSFAVGHYHEENSSNVDFNLYGHSFEPGHFEKNGTICLNGLLNINVIDLSNKNVFQLEYPIGTNGSRLMELKRIGL